MALDGDTFGHQRRFASTAFTRLFQSGVKRANRDLVRVLRDRRRSALKRGIDRVNGADTPLVSSENFAVEAAKVAVGAQRAGAFLIVFCPRADDERLVTPALSCTITFHSPTERIGSRLVLVRRSAAPRKLNETRESLGTRSEPVPQFAGAPFFHDNRAINRTRARPSDVTRSS